MKLTAADGSSGLKRGGRTHGHTGEEEQLKARDERRKQALSRSVLCTTCAKWPAFDPSKSDDAQYIKEKLLKYKKGWLRTWDILQILENCEAVMPSYQEDMWKSFNIFLWILQEDATRKSRCTSTTRLSQSTSPTTTMTTSSTSGISLPNITLLSPLYPEDCRYGSFMEQQQQLQQ
jgi:hypothetical protein